MKRSTLWASALLVLWIVPCCGSVDSENTATIVIAEGNSLLFQARGSEPVIYGAGDSLLVEWDNGTCRVNGEVYAPQLPTPPKVYAVQRLKERYGSVPVVLEYVDSHSGDSVDVWNEAYREWEKEMRQLVRDVQLRSASALGQGEAPDSAADAAVVMLLESPLVHSARVYERRPPVDSPKVTWDTSLRLRKPLNHRGLHPLDMDRELCRH